MSTSPDRARLPPDGRLAEIARLGPLGWWQDHGRTCATCAAEGPSCDLGHALVRVHAAELLRRGTVGRA